MAEEKPKPTVKTAAEGIDYTGRPFGHVMPDAETAMICEQDPVIRDKLVGELKKMGFLTAQPATYKEALKHMRFHVFNVIFIDEDFDTGVWETNNVLRYLENLNMAIRRKSFVVLVSATLTTLDYLEGFNKSVNLVINKRDVGSVEKIMRQAMADHEDFYHVFKEKIQK
ncbi:MAG: response regulator [Deltaproteobacteria bacterium]